MFVVTLDSKKVIQRESHFADHEKKWTLNTENALLAARRDEREKTPALSLRSPLTTSLGRGSQLVSACCIPA